MEPGTHPDLSRGGDLGTGERLRPIRSSYPRHRVTETDPPESKERDRSPTKLDKAHRPQGRDRSRRLGHDRPWSRPRPPARPGVVGDLRRPHGARVGVPHRSAPLRSNQGIRQKTAAEESSALNEARPDCSMRKGGRSAALSHTWLPVTRAGSTGLPRGRRSSSTEATATTVSRSDHLSPASA